MDEAYSMHGTGNAYRMLIVNPEKKRELGRRGII